MIIHTLTQNKIRVTYAVSPVDIDVDSILERKHEADGVVLEIFLHFIVITAEKRDLVHSRQTFNHLFNLKDQHLIETLLLYINIFFQDKIKTKTSIDIFITISAIM